MSTRLDSLSEAITAGRGLPETVRVAARTLEASLLVTDDAGATIAVAARSSADERALMHGGPPVLAFDLRRGGRTVGRLRVRRPGRADPPPPGLLRVVRTLVAAEVERRGAGERSARAEEAALARALLGGNPPPDSTSALADGAGVILVRASERRLLLLVRRAARAVVHASAATAVDAPAGEARVALVVPAADEAAVHGAAEGIRQRLLRAEPGIRLAVGHSRRAAAPRDLERAGKEAALAAHLADGSALAFEATGAYRLLLSAGAELRPFYEDTVGPLVEHDAAHRTGLVETLATFLASDGSFAKAAERIGAHRHTVRYRLATVRSLTGLDANSTRGREQLGLGLKAMRVLTMPA